MGLEIKVAANGRMVIPLDVRRALGLENGGSVWLEESETALTLRTRRQRLRNARALAQEMLKDKPTMSVDDFLAQRRAEHERELAHEKEMFG